MAVTAKLYGLAMKRDNWWDWDADTIKVMLCTSAYTPDQDTHRYKSSVTNELVATGYTATGATLGSKTSVYTSGTNTHALDAADTAWTTATWTTARYAVVYDATPATDATRPLICYIDFGADQSVTAGTFTIQWPAGGIVSIVVS